MKYIDADRLRKELNKWRDIQPTTVGLPRKATYEAMGVIQTIDHVLYLIDSLQQEMWKPSEEQITAAKSVYSVLKSHDTWGEDEHLPILMSLINDLQKLL